MSDNFLDLRNSEPVTEQEEAEASLKANAYGTKFSEELYAAVREAISAGNNRVNQSKTEEILSVDDSWIQNIEDSLYSVEKIAKKPVTFIKENREITPIEKVRRADTVAMRHLARHSELIRKVEDDGRVIPSKIFAGLMDEELAIYENRVVYTLVLMLKRFVNERYDSIKELINRYETTNVFLDSKFPFGKSKIEYKLDMRIHQRKSRVDSGESTLKKLRDIRTRIRMIENSEFYRALSKTKPVTPPINRTNLLLGQTDYRKVYSLWLFIAGFNSVGYSVSVKEKNLPVDNDYFDDLTEVVAESVKVMVENNLIRKKQYDAVKFKDIGIRKYRHARKPEITLSGDNRSGLVPEGDELNQFYYEKMKSLVKSVSKKSSARDVIEFKDVNVNFRRFYKGVSKINHAMFYDMMKISGENKKKLPEKPTPIQRRQAELRKEREIMRKYKMLVKMKEEELESLKKKELDIKQRVHKREVELSARIYMDKKKKNLKLAKEIERQKKTEKTGDEKQD